ncbi:unnamed protein product [Peronospora belbahrii]|uniref:Uncharacterized protein n=1 Tax=Peronospora belbahrii TaxID=622444 RepID=A0AAU9KNH9_9STRA|nr:unnamed protein product [Peronospora belbahrii]
MSLQFLGVERKYTEEIRGVGLRLRNVRCVRCGDWGHQSGDIECKLRYQNPNEAARLRWEDLMTEINKFKSELSDDDKAKKAFFWENAD